MKITTTISPVIAFTNMRSKQKDAQLDVKVLLQKTLLLFEHDK